MAVQPGWRDEALDPDVARWLVSPPGVALVDRLVDALGQGLDDLAVGTLAREGGTDPARAAVAVQAATSRRAARQAGHALDWWTPAALEQASDPLVARWRAQRFADGGRVIDLTAGCGADAAVLAEVVEILAMERDLARVHLLRANLLTVAPTLAGDALRPPVAVAGLAYADPGRRHGDTRLRRLAEVRPSVPALRGSGWDGLGIAVSPAVDLADPDLPGDAELEFVQVGSRLVEATLWHGDLRSSGPGPVAERSATLLPAGHHLRGAPQAPTAPGAPGPWFAIPVPALVRARLVDEQAGQRGLRRLARERPLFWADAAVPDDPWFVYEEVVGTSPARPKAVRAVLRDAGVDLPVEVVLHGVRADVTGWVRDLRSPTGPQGLRVHLVRTDDRAIAVVAHAPRRPGGDHRPPTAADGG